MIRINEIKLPLEATQEDVLAAAAKALRCPKRKIRTLEIARKSLDSRKKDNLFFVYSVDVTVDGDETELLERSGCKKAMITEPFSYTLETLLKIIILNLLAHIPLQKQVQIY